jgi:diguanylate cyclase (GGDEF)-like protein/hemerythrin-like metal-binding protein/PAS domain S-box-containing protein
MAPPRILIVEDELITARNLELTLRSLGYEIAAIASTGKGSVQKADDTHPDLVLMDIMLEDDMDGIQAAKLIRSRQDTPVVYLSAHSDRSLLGRATETEPSGYLIKPFSRQELHAAIETALHKHEIEKRLAASEEDFRRLFNALGDFLFILDERGGIVHANSLVFKRLGYSESRVIGRHLTEVHPSHNRQDVIQTIEQIWSGTIDSYSIPLLAGDGSQIPVETRVTRGHWRGRNVLFGICRDITHIKQTEEMLVSARNELESRVRERTSELLEANQNLRAEIRERTKAEEALRESQQMLRVVFDAIPVAVFWKDRESVYLGCNRKFADDSGLALPEDIKGKTDYDLPWKKEEADFFRKCDRRVMDSGSPEFHIIEQVLYADGTQAWVNTNKVPLLDSERNVVGILGTYEDITSRKLAEEKLDLAAMIIAGSNEAIVVTDTQATIVDVNQAFCTQSGYSREELIGNNPRVLKSGRHDSDFYEKMWHDLTTKGQWQGEIWDRRKSGEIYPKLLSVSTVRNHENIITHYVGFSSDITRIKQTEERLQQLAHYDELTGLANRVLFRDRLNLAIAEARRKKHKVGLILLDLDRFKDINDTLGHPVGDKVLISVADRLKKCVRETDTVGRLGGDEFIIVLPELLDAAEVTQIGRRIIEALSRRFDPEGRQVFISTSIGVTLYPSDGDDADKLLQNADTALYRAKERGKNHLQFFSKEMNLELMDRAELEVALRNALESNELDLYYQPIVELETGKVVSVEALLRWNHPTRGAISPLKIVPLAEETGLILPLGEWVLRTACQQNKKWQDLGLQPIRVAVNVSGHQLMHPGFVKSVFRVLEDTGHDPKYLELELTESTAMRDVTTTVQAFRQFKAKGISIAIDDFGTGYSSLSYLKRFPIDKLKIDRSFVQDIATRQEAEPIVRAIVAVGHSLHLKVLAEGVETHDQFGLLWSLDCDEWQGYSFSKPVPAEEIEKMLREGRRALSLNFRWTPDLAVHVPKIDGQHQAWFKRVDELCKSIMRGRGEHDLHDFVRFLSDYSRLHFKDEEALMLEHDYPEYKRHHKEHQMLEEQVAQINDRVENDEITTELLVEVVERLHKWFAGHIKGSDRVLGDFLKSRQ